MMIVTPILDDVLELTDVEELERLVELWRERYYPGYDIDDIRIHVQLTKL